MNHYSEFKRKVHSLIGDSINNRIYYIVHSAKVKDNLNYSLCLSEKEKIKYTSEAIKELQQVIKSCKTADAIILSALIENNPSDKLSFEERKVLIIQNYFLAYYSEVLNYLTESENSEDLTTIDVNHYINHLGLDVERLEKFIINIANAERYVGLVSMLEKINEVAPKVSNSLEAKISELQKMTDEFIPQVISNKLTPLLNSSNDLKVIDSTIKKIVNEYYQTFDAVRGEILSALDTLKNKSKTEYIKGISQTYNQIIKLVYDDRHFAYDSIVDYYENRQNDPSFYCYLSVYKELHNSILKGITDELLINRLSDFDKAFDLPSNFTEIKNYINKGLYEMDLFMNGKINEMSYYNIPRAVEKFNSLRFKYENNPKQSLSMLNKYFTAISTLDHNIDKGIFSNDKVHDDINFTVMCNQLCYFKSDILNLFTADEIAESEPDDLKIIDILDTDEIVEEVKNQKIDKKETSKNIAFTYVGTSASFKPKITEFKNCLVDDGFIDKSTKLADFNKIFKNRLPGNPIIWLGSRTDLKYLIRSLKESKLIQSVGNDLWKITSNCFIVDDNTTYDFRKYKSLKDPTPAICNKLDRIIRVL